MSAEQKNDAEESTSKKGGGKGKLIIIIVGILLLAGALGTGAFFALHKPAPEKTEDAADEETHAEEDEGEPEKGELPGAVIPLEPLIVNLKDKSSFLRIGLQLEISEPEVPKHLEDSSGRIKDAVITVLTTKTAEDVLSIDGKNKLKGELLNSINTSLGKDDVTAVYFTEFIIQ